MIIWRTANLITRTFTSEATQDWLTGTAFPLSSDRDTYNVRGSATISKPRVPGALSSTSTDTSFDTAILHQCRPSEFGSGNDAAMDISPHSSHGSALGRTDSECPSNSSSTGVVTPHGRGDFAEKGRLSMAMNSNQASTFIIHDLKVKRESSKPLLRDVVDQPFSRSAQGLTQPFRTLRTKRGFIKSTNAHDSVTGSVPMNPFEPAPDAGTLPDVQETKYDLFQRVESSSDLSDYQPQPAALHNAAPLYFHKWKAVNGDGDPMNVADLDDKAAAWHKPGSDLYALRESPKIEASGIPQERPQDVIPELEKEPMNGLPTRLEMDASSDVVGRKNAPRYPNAEMNDAAAVSDDKESSPNTKDSADVNNQTSPRKTRLKDKIRGEMKVLTGKLGKKIAAGKKMMAKFV